MTDHAAPSAFFRARTLICAIVRWCRTHPFGAAFTFIGVVSLVFLAVPGLDLLASGLFYTPGEGFTAASSPFLQKLRYLGPYLVQTVAVICGFVLLLKLLLPELPPLMPLRKPVFLLSTLVLGPGILVNTILKNNWGRPRPVMVEQFGGDLPFIPVWLKTDWCSTNCSFVSGEGSASMWLMALAFVVPKSWRPAVVLTILPLMLALSVNRVAFGGHFLSDTLLAWGLTFLVLLSVYWLLYVRTPRWAGDAQLDAGLSAAGLRLRRAVLPLLAAIGRALRAFVAKFR
ncbi:phosphatase PAP2 family protein [Pannonibacter indicus]|uniref:Membrane-associated enzyme, PAP2 (Acid phosphatase) superfamily n=1 Tax=Pannonibacter indicus TaxID=466044 RepID=A0A0K6HT20_9HYPH|nr:phosphatase PAP2 family protein [Pannonibacter indicus]CUA93928.1 Membrane-associated enzyme, PAP2 (acid phosphatase) superfamily [Pannonibacter indicus]